MGRRLVVEADGGSRGNPGPSGYGAVVSDADTREVLAEVQGALGHTTNNVAEYSGLIAGLAACAAFGPESIRVRMDSKLVVEQMAKRWQVKAEHLRPLFEEAQKVAAGLGVPIVYAHIPRALNAHADRLANLAMDDQATGGLRGVPLESQDAQRVFPPAAMDNDPGLAESGATDPTADGGESSSVRPGTPAPDRRLAGWNQPPTAPTTTFLLRHGQSTLSVDKRFNGTSDPPLTDVGVEQAEAAAARLLRLTDGGHGFAAIISSPLRRAKHTAEIAAAALGLDVHVEAGFRETAFGEWEGATYAEVAKGWPAELAAWHANIEIAPPGGESFADTERRVRAARDQLLVDFPGQRILVVAHVSPIKVLTWLALGASPEALFRTSLDLASLTEVDWYPDGGSVLRRFNDAAHLEL